MELCLSEFYTTATLRRCFTFQWTFQKFHNPFASMHKFMDEVIITSLHGNISFRYWWEKQKQNSSFPKKQQQFVFSLILTIPVWLLQTICATQSMQNNAVCSVLIHNKLSRLFSLLLESLGQIKGTVCHVSQADQISLDLVNPKLEAEPLIQTQCPISPFLLYCLLVFILE